ncbi:hypothetical protein [Cellulosimicrobium cellulans]|uniref:hypothetical protein n=1 Tax=Cellulosimicrobium cellulans TaxID=1710 RepID=UPI00130DB57F|nr:hypothetical protein [Cellulosimicrobium cellulans]
MNNKQQSLAPSGIKEHRATWPCAFLQTNVISIAAEDIPILGALRDRPVAAKEKHMSELTPEEIANIPPEEVDEFPMGDDPTASQDAVDLGNRNPD